MIDVSELPDIESMSERDMIKEKTMWLRASWSMLPDVDANPTLRRSRRFVSDKVLLTGCREEWSSKWSYRIRMWIRKKRVRS